MDWLSTISFDQIGLSFLTVFFVRETLVFILPDHIAGPEGWFIDTGRASFEH